MEKELNFVLGLKFIFRFKAIETAKNSDWTNENSKFSRFMNCPCIKQVQKLQLWVEQPHNEDEQDIIMSTIWTTTKTNGFQSTFFFNCTQCGL